MGVLDGKRVAEKLQQEIGLEIARLKNERGVVPGLVVIMVGDHAASAAYVNSKARLAEKMGIHSRLVKLPQEAAAADVMAAVAAANDDASVHAVLVQMPLPAHLDSWEVIDRIAPEKDVDALHPVNQGLIMQNRGRVFPCTPLGIMRLLEHHGIDPAGMSAAVVGRSPLVGKPMAMMLSNRNATVTLCHSRTAGLAEILRESGLVVAAVGRPGFIRADMVKPGAILIDVGINRIEREQDFDKCCPRSQYEAFKKKGSLITGDIHYQAFAKALHYTPVPGGVGPLTVTMLMHNTVELCKRAISVTRDA